MKIYAVVEPRVLDFGPTIYVGELRTEDDKPISEHLNGRHDGRNLLPLTVGPTEAGVFEVLQKRARDIINRPHVVIIRERV